MKSINRGIWSVMVNDYTIPTQVVENKTIEKPYKSWSQEEIRRAKYDFKAMNIIHSVPNLWWIFQGINMYYDIGNVRSHLSDLWRYSNSYKSKEEFSHSRVWIFLEDAIRRNHMRYSKEVHSHSESPQGPRERVWGRKAKCEDFKVP